MHRRSPTATTPRTTWLISTKPTGCVTCQLHSLFGGTGGGHSFFHKGGQGDGRGRRRVRPWRVRSWAWRHSSQTTALGLATRVHGALGYGGTVGPLYSAASVGAGYRDDRAAVDGSGDRCSRRASRSAASRAARSWDDIRTWAICCTTADADSAEEQVADRAAELARARAAHFAEAEVARAAWEDTSPATEAWARLFTASSLRSAASLCGPRMSWFLGAGGPVPLTPGYVPYIVDDPVASRLLLIRADESQCSVSERMASQDQRGGLASSVNPSRVADLDRRRSDHGRSTRSDASWAAGTWPGPTSPTQARVAARHRRGGPRGLPLGGTKPALAQPPQPFVPEITERSGLLMRFAGTPEVLPPDPHRDFFYNTRYADTGVITHPNWFKTQGLYGLGMKTPATKSVYPFFYGMPGQSSIDSSSRPWWRPARFFQGLAQPWRPVGMYYSFGTLRADLRPRPDRPGAWALSVPVLLQLAARRLADVMPASTHGYRPSADRRLVDDATAARLADQRMSGDRFSAASVMNA